MNDSIIIESKVNNSNLESIIKNANIQYPSDSLGFFKSVFAQLEVANKNHVILDEDVKKDIPQLVGQQVNFGHYRKIGYCTSSICGSILWADINKNNEIEIVFSFYKSLYEEEYTKALEDLSKGALTVSFELKADKNDIVSEGQNRRIKRCVFEGCGLLFEETPPACPVAIVSETAQLDALREQDLIFAKQIQESKDNKNLIQQFEGSHWSAKYINKLPNTSFAVIEPSYLEGNTNDKRARHLPFKDHEGNIDAKHYRYALRKLDKIVPFTDSITNEELITKAQKALDKIEINDNTEDNNVDKKVNDELLAKLKDEVLSEFGEEAIKDWTDEDYTEEKIQALRDSLKEESDKTSKETENVEAQKEKSTETRVYEVEDKEDGSMDVVETITIVNEVDGKVVKDEKIVRTTVYAMEKVEAMKAEYEEKLSEKDTIIVAKDAEIEKVKSSASIVAQLKVELGDYVKDYSEDDLLNDDKVEIARLKKERDELKASSTASDVSDENNEVETASVTNDEDNTLKTGSSDAQDDVKADVTGFLKQRRANILSKKN